MPSKMVVALRQKYNDYVATTSTAQRSDYVVRAEGVTKLFPKGFDRQNSIFLHPHGKRKLAPEFHLSALNFESPRAIFLHLFQEKT